MPSAFTSARPALSSREVDRDSRNSELPLILVSVDSDHGTNVRERNEDLFPVVREISPG